MRLVVLPSEITEGALPRHKCLRGFVVDNKTNTVAGGKMVVEIHVAAKDDPGEVYQLEAWGAVATRADKIEHKAYEFTKCFAKSAEGRAMWTPSTAPTWGLMQGASEWQEEDAAEFPRTFPTTSLEILKGILYFQQVCVCEGQSKRAEHEGIGCRGHTGAVAQIQGKGRGHQQGNDASEGPVDSSPRGR